MLFYNIFLVLFKKEILMRILVSCISRTNFFFPLAPSVRIHRPAELLTLRRRDSLPLKASNSVRPFHSYTVVDRHIRRHLTE